MGSKQFYINNRGSIINIRRKIRNFMSKINWFLKRHKFMTKLFLCVLIISLIGYATIKIDRKDIEYIGNLIVAIITGYILSEYYDTKNSYNNFIKTLRSLLKQIRIIQKVIEGNNKDFVSEYFTLTPYRDNLAAALQYCLENGIDSCNDLMDIHGRLSKIEENIHKNKGVVGDLEEITRTDILYCESRIGLIIENFKKE